MIVAAPSTSTSTQTGSVPTADDHLGRVHARRAALARQVEQLPTDEVLALASTLKTIGDGLRAEADQLGATIPSDGNGNPLPEGEAHRLLWSALTREAEAFENVWGALSTVAAKRITAPAREQ